MTEDTASPIKRAIRWAITPPQAWGVYLLALLLVWLISFYAGTLRPKKAPEASPSAVTAPRS